jgi:hypothetical protein
MDKRGHHTKNLQGLRVRVKGWVGRIHGLEYRTGRQQKPFDGKFSLHFGDDNVPVHRLSALSTTIRSPEFRPISVIELPIARTK